MLDSDRIFFALQELVAGRYSIVRELGRGGMGIVFLARDVALDRPVAIKLLPPELATSRHNRDRFVREARVAGGLAHPHIVPIHAVEEHGDIVFFAMGFVDGETLGERVTRTGPLVPSEAMRIVEEVAFALAHAHARGVVHRDVKPDNILLERGSGRALVTDFGIARVEASAGDTGEGRIVGTPRYMSPEQASGGDVDARSDVYSLGVVAFFAATGRTPFEADSAAAMLAKHVATPPPSVASIRPGLPPRFAAAIDRCLSKDPAARFATAEELAVQLRSMSGNAIEIAPAVRGFLRETNLVGSEVGTALTAAVTSLVMLALVSLTTGGGIVGAINRAVQWSLYLGISASMLGLAGVRLGQLVARARDLLRVGYGHSAVRPAAVVDERARLEEEPTGDQRRPTLGGLLLRAGATFASMWLAQTDTPLAVVGIAGSVAIPTLALRGIWANMQRGRQWWSRMIQGSVGETIFRVAGIRIGTRALSTPAAGEPTALAVGQAVDDLFAALPAAQREQLSELPSIVARLEADALALRARTPVPERNARLSAAVAALETLRLDLLRLNAAAATPGDLTRDIEAAKRISDELGARVERIDGARRVLRE